MITGYELDLLDYIWKFTGNGFLDGFFILLTRLGDMGMIWIVISLYLIFDGKHRRTGYLTLAALLLATIIGEGFLKNVFMRTRPFDLKESVELLVNAPVTFSFPSGHTTSSFAAAGVLAYGIKEGGKYFYILAFLVAFSRIYLYLHFPSDVLAGMALGSLVAFIVVKGYERWTRGRN